MLPCTAHSVTPGLGATARRCMLPKLQAFLLTASGVGRHLYPETLSCPDISLRQQLVIFHSYPSLALRFSQPRHQQTACVVRTHGNPFSDLWKVVFLFCFLWYRMVRAFGAMPLLSLSSLSVSLNFLLQSICYFLPNF